MLDDPVTGQLYVYSLRIARDSLAVNSVKSLAEATIKRLQADPVTRADLMAKLALRGYTPVGRDESVARGGVPVAGEPAGKMMYPLVRELAEDGVPSR